LQASKPFLYMDLRLPPRHVDVNTHPTKREVGFIHQARLDWNFACVQVQLV